MSKSADHPAHMQHHFSDSQQQQESAKLGLWVFLMTEILMFGGLFLAYAVFRAWNSEMFMEANTMLDVQMGAFNTVVLIVSSVTMALAIRSMQLNNKNHTLVFLGSTWVLAAVFLVVKFFEYSHKIHEGLLPGKFYFFEGLTTNNPHIFFSLYFMMTGLHGIHIIGGMIVIGWLIVKTMRNRFSSQYYTPIEMTGLYWHLVDLIWIFLFPLFYLIG